MSAAALFPPLEPFRTHRLAVGDGHELKVEECGRADGEPVLFLHGEMDRVVPIRFGRKLYEAAAEPKRALWHPEAQHTNIMDYPGVTEEIIDFIRNR